LNALFALNLPKREDIIDMMLPPASTTLFAAREKGGKGLMAIDCLASVAAEEPFLDRAVRGGSVGYFALEEHIAVVRDRVGARIGNRRDVPLLVFPLDGIALPDDDLDRTPDRLLLDDPESMQKLHNTVTHHHLDVAVIDVLREAHNRDENNADEMAPLLRPIRQLAHGTGAAVIVNHHMNRENTFRGSTAILAAFDQEWALVGTDGDDTDSTLRGTLTVKGRYYPRQLLRVELGGDMRWHAVDALPEPPDTRLRTRILAHLDTANEWQTAEQIAAAMTPTKVKTVQNVLSAMMKESPLPFVSTGQGGKHDPRRYSTLNRRLDLDSSLPDRLGKRSGRNDGGPLATVISRHSGNGREVLESAESHSSRPDALCLGNGRNNDDDVDFALGLTCLNCGVRLLGDRRYYCEECQA
jgi:hypothetical protein